MKKLVFATLSLSLLAACGHESYVSSPPWKETDKHLTCDQVLLEMNDAKYWNAQAQKNTEVGVMDILWPPAYLNTRQSAEEAMEITNQRISHLQNIYNIKGCHRPYPNTQVPLPGS